MVLKRAPPVRRGEEGRFREARENLKTHWTGLDESPEWQREQLPIATRVQVRIQTQSPDYHMYRDRDTDSFGDRSTRIGCGLER